MTEILIADDEAHARRILQLALEKAGYTVRVAQNGAEALDMFRQQRPDILLTDIQMPKMTGEQLCKQLMSEFPNLETPIFVLTSRAEREHRDWVTSMPHGNFIEKPVSIKQLLKSLSALTTPSNTDGV